MSKLVNSIVFISTVLILFYFAGVLENTATTKLLDFLLNTDLWKSDNVFVDKLDEVIKLAGVSGAIVAGFLLGERTNWGIKAGLAGFMFLVGWDLVAIFNKVAELDVFLAVLVLSPMAIAYFIIVINWFGGTDV